jgi:hypothetical protein
LEQALFIEDLSELDTIHPDYSRVYFGEEYCGRRLAPPQAFRRVAERCCAIGKRLTLLTPVVTDPELGRLGDALAPALAIGSAHPELELELIFNDWGVFEQYRGLSGFSPVLGTLLVKQKRDPGFWWLERGVRSNAADLRHIRGLNIDANDYLRGFIETSFARIELSNTVQGWSTRCRLPASLSLPLVPVTTTRYCKWAAAAAGRRNASDYVPCSQPCRTRIARYRNRDHVLYLYGNTQFYVNPRLPFDLGGVDRLVSYSFAPFFQAESEAP